MITLGITYEIFTPESVENGGAEERGWHTDKHNWQPGDLRTAIETLNEHGYVEASSSEMNNNTWFTAYDTSERCWWNLETGGYENLSLHIDGCTLSTRKRIHNLLTS